MYRTIGPGDELVLLDSSLPKEERDRAAKKVEEIAMADRDSENRYYWGAILARTGYQAAALRLLRKGVEDGYLCHENLDRDPMWDSVRKNPEFAAIREESVRRQKEFLEKRTS